jgi:hypothetical protein
MKIIIVAIIAGFTAFEIISALSACPFLLEMVGSLAIGICIGQAFHKLFFWK